MDKGTIVAVIFVLLIFSFLIFLVVFSINRVIALFKGSKKAKQELKAEQKEKGYIEKQIMYHSVGLPIAENEQCVVMYYEDKIEIESNGAIFSLDLNKVLDMTVTTDVEVQKHTVSSAGGAVAGALMFGAVGALIGGRAKTKETKKVTYLLVVTYEKDDKTEYIVFDLKAYGFYEPKLVQLFKRRPKLVKKQIAL